MSDPVTASIFRYNPETDTEPYYEEYQTEVEEKISVLMLLKQIQEEIDDTLSFRCYCCGLQMCQSCLMRINHTRKFACLTLVKPGDKIIIEPLTYPESHIKDLVVKFTEKE